VFIIAGSISVPEQSRDALVAELGPLLAKTRLQPGVIDYCIGPDPADPTKLAVIEVFESDESFAHHTAHGTLEVISALIGKYGPTGSAIGRYQATAL
jgi:quinol monooxygenase YgiN